MKTEEITVLHKKQRACFDQGKLMGYFSSAHAPHSFPRGAL